LLPLSAHPQRTQLNQVEAETREKHLHPDLPPCGHQYMPSVENPLDQRERPLPRSSLPVDTPVPQPVPYPQRTTLGPTPHRCRLPTDIHAEIRLVHVGHLPRKAKVNLTVVDAGHRRLQVQDEAQFDIGLGVQLVPIVGSAPLLGPVAIPAPPRLRLLSQGLPLLSRVSGDERGVLDHALPDPEVLHVELALQLLPNEPIPTRFGEALPELPDRGVVWQDLWEPKETLEADAIRHLTFQLGIAEAILLLEDEGLHHHHLVHIGASSLGPWLW